MRSKPMAWFEFDGSQLQKRGPGFIQEVRDSVEEGLRVLEEEIQEDGLLEYDVRENTEHVVMLTIDSKSGITKDEHEERFRPAYTLDTGEVNPRSEVVWEQAKLWLPDTGVDYLLDQVDEYMDVYDFSLDEELILLMAVEEKEHVKGWRRGE